MIAAWVLYSLVVGGSVALAAAAADRGARALRLPTRLIWVAALLMTLFLSAFALLRLTHEQPLGIRGAPGTSGAAPTVDASSGGVQAVPGLLQQLYGGVGRAGGDHPLIMLWMLVSMLLLLLGMATVLRLWRARRTWGNEFIAGYSVLVAPDFGPAVVGLIRPAIVIPVWLLSRPEESRSLVVQHEAEHRRAGDHLLLGLACLIVVLLPWHPAVWWLLHRTRLAIELDCDARVLRTGASALTYGSLLLEIAKCSRRHSLAAPALADTRLHLERRLLAMTAQMLHPMRARAVAAGAMTTGLLLIAIACSTDRPTSADVKSTKATDSPPAGAVRYKVKMVSNRPPAGVTFTPYTVPRELTREGPYMAYAKGTGTDTMMHLLVSRWALVIIDGQVSSAAEARKLTYDRILKLEQIDSIPGRGRYGERGRHGVVLVTTK